MFMLGRARPGLCTDPAWWPTRRRSRRPSSHVHRQQAIRRVSSSPCYCVAFPVSHITISTLHPAFKHIHIYMMYNFKNCSYIHYLYRLSAFICSFICSHIRIYVCIFANLCVADYCAFARKFKTIKFFFLKRRMCGVFFSTLAEKNKKWLAFIVCLCNSIFWFFKRTQLPHVSSIIDEFSSCSVLILVVSVTSFVPHLIIRRRNSLAIKICNQPCVYGIEHIL